MKLYLLPLVLFLLVSCKKEVKKEPLYPVIQSETVNEVSSELELGKKIFNGKGQCLACHKPTQKVIGPSVIDIVKIYKEKDADMVAFLKGNLDPIVDPSQFEVMKVNLEITKKMTDQELQAVVNYMYSLSEK